MRKGFWLSARSWPTSSARSSQGFVAVNRMCPWWWPTTRTNGSTTRRCPYCSNDATNSSTGPSRKPSCAATSTMLAQIGVTDTAGRPLRYTFHDFRRLFITDAIMHGMPPHIAQLVAGHRDINTTMGYKNSQELHQTGELNTALGQLAA